MTSASLASAFHRTFILLPRSGPGWKRHAFGDGALTVLEMLNGVLERRKNANLQ